jgi:D-beta-D-heptose 7-phosphate kinase/D-beta-D-heptose 1-phosphate adenosyltransferase
MDTVALLKIVNNIKAASILCIGDVILDYFVEGVVERISPEAPVPVFKKLHDNHGLGGAANVLHNLATLGISCGLASVIGADQEGHRLRELLLELNLISLSLIEERNRPTTMKTRYVVGGQQLLRVDREVSSPLGQTIAHTLLKTIEEQLIHYDVVILSDYNKGLFSQGVERTIIDLLLKHRKRILIDPKGKDFSRYRGATILTPNHKELALAMGMPTDNDREVVEAAKAVLSQYDIQAVLVTRGSQGMSLVDTLGTVEHIAAEVREVFDVSGAGDTVIAIFAAAYGNGASLKEAAQLANIAAGLVVGKVGTATLRLEEIFSALHMHNFKDSEIKMANLEKALEVTQMWRRKGLQVGFTNGCFDLLHPGHISLLKQAKAQCDRLVIGLNSDASVKRLKGNMRPIQSEEARATILASMSDVDLVVVFEEDTPINLITLLRPDVLVKGADYTVDQVVGADVVQSYGGTVVLAQLMSGQSTTNTVQKLMKDSKIG